MEFRCSGRDGSPTQRHQLTLPRKAIMAYRFGSIRARRTQQPYPVPLCHLDVMLMNGTFGQFVAVLPSSNVVIVRLGETHDWDLARDPDSLITDLLKAFRKT